ncbi:MAG: DNA mismatch repair protein MutS [Chloroflexi bacterium]|nr:DNA mismatch repair protein MutS [Chloroflexota bacterium]
MTPMFDQFFGIKKQNPDCILLFRVGDFYETYGEDAETAARELNILLTSKEAGKSNKIAMAGVPHHSVAPYIRTLVQKGFKVAICDQVEDPKKAKGLVKREVTRIITPGTVLDDDLLDESANNFIMAITVSEEKPSGGEFSLVEEKNIFSAGIAAADLSTGEFYTTALVVESAVRLMEEVRRFDPSEILLVNTADDMDGLAGILGERGTPVRKLSPRELLSCEDIIKKTFGLPSLLGNAVSREPEAIRASGSLLFYLREVLKNRELSFGRLCTYTPSEYMVIDATTMRNLEIFKTQLTASREGSLLWALDNTDTPMGARMLRRFLERPLTSIDEINSRLDSVEELINTYNLLTRLKDELKKIRDVERIFSRIAYGTANARDLRQLADSLVPLVQVRESADLLLSRHLKGLAGNIDPVEDLRDLLLKAVEDNPPVTIKEGGMFRKGYNAELDELREIRGNAKRGIAEIEKKEKERTGIKSLKIGFNKVFGYYVEVTRPNLSLVPGDYIRKQTTVNAERFICPELKEYESKVLSADERIKDLEYELFQEMRDKVSTYKDRIMGTCEALAELDVLCGFGNLAVRHRYVRPLLTGDHMVEIREGRHPVVERMVVTGFVPNDIFMDDETRYLVVTGPNMSGKSTYLRQAALICIMAQIGSFVPADSATLGIMDRVFTRVGASDDLHLGQSTFMVEMQETANIINSATPQSLVILDEVGRGTSTFDGMSLAWAVTEFICEKVRAKTIFATHFHELTQLAKRYPQIKNLRVTVREEGGDVVFLHKMVPGGADRSYGLYVAKLAGIPQEVIDRASEILEKLEQEKKVGKKIPGPEAVQMGLFRKNDSPVIDELKKVNLMEISPLQALNLLHEWQKQLLD